MAQKVGLARRIRGAMGVTPSNVVPLAAAIPGGLLTDQYGDVLSGHSVYVYKTGTNTQVAVTQADGVTPITQPLVSGSTGYVPGYVLGEQVVDVVDAVTAVKLVGAQVVSAADLAQLMSTVVTTGSADSVIPPQVRIGDSLIDLCRPPYNATPGQDITTALQNAVNALAANAVPGGEIYFSQPGTYLINGAQQPGTVTQANGVNGYSGAAQTYTYSGQIVYPATPQAGECSIIIRGAIPANSANDADTFPAGTILSSNATSGNVFDMIPAQTKYGLRNGIRPVFEDIVVQCPSNPQCGGIMAMLAFRFQSKNLEIIAGYSGTSLPTGSGIALCLPYASNSGDTKVEAQIVGFPVGVALSEHAQLQYVYIGRCVVAIRGIGAAHVSKFHYVDVEECVTVFQALNPGGQPDGSAGGLNVEGLLDGENGQSGVWAQGSFIDEWVGGAIKGVITRHSGVGWGSFPLRAGKVGLGLDIIDNNVLGTPGWKGRHPSDNFARTTNSVFANGSPGQCSPTLHPWGLTAGGFDLSAGALKGHTGSDQAYLPCLKGGVSRSVTAAVALASGSWVNLVAQRTIDSNGNVQSNFAYLIIFAGAAILKIQSNGVVTTNINGPAVSVGAHTLAIRMIHDQAGAPTHVTAYVDGVQFVYHALTATEKAALTPASNAISPYAMDGLWVQDTGVTSITGFTVRDAVPDPAYQASGTATLVAGTSSPAVTLTTNSTTSVSAISPALPVGSVYAVVGAGIPAGATMTVTGSGTTGTLSSAATASASGVAVTTTFSNPNITAASKVRVFNDSPAGTVGALSVSMSAGVGFTINSTSAADTSTIYYEIASY